MKNLTGFHEHEMTSSKYRNPQWTMSTAGARFKNPVSQSPGPANYSAEKVCNVTKYGKNTKISAVITGKRSEKGRTKNQKI